PHPPLPPFAACGDGATGSPAASEQPGCFFLPGARPADVPPLSPRYDGSGQKKRNYHAAFWGKPLPPEEVDHVSFPTLQGLEKVLRLSGAETAWPVHRTRPGRRPRTLRRRQY